MQTLTYGVCCAQEYTADIISSCVTVGIIPCGYWLAGHRAEAMHRLLHEGEARPGKGRDGSQLQADHRKLDTIVHGRGWKSNFGLECGKAFSNSLAAPHNDRPHLIAEPPMTETAPYLSTGRYYWRCRKAQKLDLVCRDAGQRAPRCLRMARWCPFTMRPDQQPFTSTGSRIYCHPLR